MIESLQFAEVGSSTDGNSLGGSFPSIGCFRKLKTEDLRPQLPFLDESSLLDQPSMEQAGTWDRGISRGAATIIIGLSLLFLYSSYRPIWHTDIWGHLAYGRVIRELGAIPTTEPLLPLSKGIPFVDSPWLFQLIGFEIASSPRLGIAGLQGLFALLLTACAALLAAAAFRQTGNSIFGIAATAGFLVIGWEPLLVLRPQLAGLVCYVFLLTRMMTSPPRSTDWMIIPLTFALWANIHASFLVGLGLLGSMIIGRACDALFLVSAKPESIPEERSLRQLSGLAFLAAATALFNPYRLDLYREAVQFSANENLKDLLEWQPLFIREPQGVVFAMAVMGLVLIYRLTPRKIATWELLSLCGLGFATLWSVRMIVWWAPLASLLLAVHGHAALNQILLHSRNQNLRAASVGWTLAAAVVAVICFGCSPLGMAMVSGRQPDAVHALSAGTPRFAAEYLSEHPDCGQVFNTYEWGDYLLWTGPKDVRLFVNSHAHLIPRDVWVAYMQVIELRSGWEQTLDDYQIRTIVIDRQHRGALIQALSQDDRWKQPPVEKDGQVIFERR